MSVTGNSVPHSSPPLSVHLMCQDSAHPAQPQALRGAAHENRVLCPKDTALGAASVLEGLLANIALCPATPEIRHLFTAGTWSSVQISHAQRNVIWCKK